MKHTVELFIGSPFFFLHCAHTAHLYALDNSTVSLVNEILAITQRTALAIVLNLNARLLRLVEGKILLVQPFLKRGLIRGLV